MPCFFVCKRPQEVNRWQGSSPLNVVNCDSRHVQETRRWQLPDFDLVVGIDWLSPATEFDSKELSQLAGNGLNEKTPNHGPEPVLTERLYGTRILKCGHHLLLHVHQLVPKEQVWENIDPKPAWLDMARFCKPHRILGQNLGTCKHISKVERTKWTSALVRMHTTGILTRTLRFVYQWASPKLDGFPTEDCHSIVLGYLCFWTDPETDSKLWVRLLVQIVWTKVQIQWVQRIAQMFPGRTNSCEYMRIDAEVRVFSTPLGDIWCLDPCRCARNPIIDWSMSPLLANRLTVGCNSTAAVGDLRDTASAYLRLVTDR